MYLFLKWDIRNYWAKTGNTHHNYTTWQQTGYIYITNRIDISNAIDQGSRWPSPAADKLPEPASPWNSFLFKLLWTAVWKQKRLTFYSAWSAWLWEILTLANVIKFLVCLKSVNYSHIYSYKCVCGILYIFWFTCDRKNMFESVQYLT